jgi:ABC-2 type transport system ATP-binding protein
VRGLTKIYGGTTALDGVDLDVPAGSVFGLVGPNGAGKSTFLGLLAGLRRPTSGEIWIDAPAQRRTLLPDTPRFDRWLNAREVVDLALRLSTGSGDPGRTAEVLETCGLSEAAGRTVGGFSRGMLQRLGIATAVVARPEVLLLDEPAAALDPQGRREVLDLVGALRGNATVLFSSHILSDVSAVCDRVAILSEGSLLFQGELHALLGGRGHAIRIEVVERAEALAQRLKAEVWVERCEVLDPTRIRIHVTGEAAAHAALPGILTQIGSGLVSLGSDDPTLEDVFLDLTR